MRVEVPSRLPFWVEHTPEMLLDLGSVPHHLCQQTLVLPAFSCEYANCHTEFHFLALK